MPLNSYRWRSWKNAPSSKFPDASCTFVLGFPWDSSLSYCQVYPNKFNTASIYICSWCAAQDYICDPLASLTQQIVEITILSDNNGSLVTYNTHLNLQWLRQGRSVLVYHIIVQKGRIPAVLHEFILELSTLLHCHPRMFSHPFLVVQDRFLPWPLSKQQDKRREKKKKGNTCVFPLIA